MEAARQGIRLPGHYPAEEPMEVRGTGRPFALHLGFPVFLDCFSWLIDVLSMCFR